MSNIGCYIIWETFASTAQIVTVTEAMTWVASEVLAAHAHDGFYEMTGSGSKI